MKTSIVPLAVALLALGPVANRVVRANAPLRDQPNLHLIANGTVSATARLPDGSVVIGGDFQAVNGEPHRSLAKLRPDGTLDDAFLADVQYSVGVLASDSAGAVYVGGNFTSIGGVARHNLAKLDGATGAVDPDWNPSPDAEVHAIVIDPDGAVFVGGSFTAIGGAALRGVAKLSDSGSGAADIAWAPQPSMDGTAAVYALVIDGPDLFVAGDFDSIGGLTRTDLAKLSRSGSGAVDPNWNPVVGNGGVFYHDVRAMALDTTGNAYVAGVFTSINGVNRNQMAKLSASGGAAVDTAWNANLTTFDSVSHVAATDDGSIYASGGFTEIGGVARKYLAKLSPVNGNADAVWDAAVGDCGTVDPVHALVAAGDRLLIGGSFFAIAGENRVGFAALDADAAATGPVIDAEVPGYANAIVAQADGGFVVAGEFVKADNDPRPHVLRLAPDGTLDPAWNPGIDYSVNVVAVDNVGRVYAGGTFSHAGGLARQRIARFTAAGAIDTDWNPTAAENAATLLAVNALAIDDADTLYVGGYFTHFGGEVRGGLAKVDGTGHVDADWNPGDAAAFPNISTIALDGDSVFVGGSFNALGGAARHNLAKIENGGDGAADAAWDPAPDGWTVYDVIADHAGSIYVNAPFTEIGGQPRRNLARIAAGGTGAADAGWNPGLATSPTAISFDGQYVYVGVFDVTLSTTIVRYDADCSGAADTEWSSVVDNTVHAIAAGVDSGVLIGGRFSEAEGAARGGLAGFDAPATAGCPVADDTIFADDFED